MADPLAIFFILLLRAAVAEVLTLTSGTFQEALSPHSLTVVQFCVSNPVCIAASDELLEAEA